MGELRFSAILGYSDLIVTGIINTLLLTFISGVIGFVIGVLGAEARRSRSALLRFVVGAYVEAIRNTPFLIQLFFIFFGLPSLGIKLSANMAAIIALSINFGAYSIEIIRAGLEASLSGQTEAARSLGLNTRQTFWKILLPPALAKMYLPLVSQFIIVFLGSAVVSQIAAEDLTFQAQFIQSRTFRAFEIYITITVIYLTLAFLIKTGLEYLGKKLFRWNHMR